MSHLETLILLGRPASGKSEFIDFLKKVPAAEREAEFHVGAISELDDFLWLWEKFTEDDLWEASGHPRLYSKRDAHAYVMTDEASILDYCMARFNTEFAKQTEKGTVFIEFARGAGDGGYARALNRLSGEILKDAAVLFIFTSYEEACRRNESRYRERLKHSVLAHKVPEKDMIRFAKEIDWLDITGGKACGFLDLQSNKIPFVTMNNEPELKPEDPNLVMRYKTALDKLVVLSEAKNPR